MDRPHRYDAFLSYRHEEPDRAFARDLLARLEKAGYTVAIDERDFAPNLPFPQEMERCIRESRFTLAVVSPGYRKSGNCEEEALICSVLDMGERQRRLLPLVIEKVEMPAYIYLISGIDFTAENPLLDPYEKLVRTLAAPLRLSDSDHFQLHPRVGEVFAGREKELDDIEKSLLGQGRPVAICALQGMPGVGKSYLADRFYHLHTDRFPGGYQRLVLDPAGPDPTTDSLLGELADRLKIQPDPAVVRALLLHPRTLLHVENVDSKPLAQAAVELVAKLPNCPIVVTGRYQGLGVDGGWGLVEIRPFSEKEALDQLHQEIGDKARETPEEYRRLVNALGYLPLAIHLAAGHLRAGRSVDSFLKRLLKTGLTLGLNDPADPNRATRGKEVLANTFTLSLDLLRDELVQEEMDADRLLAGFHALAQAPASGFGVSLGAAIADLSTSELEELAAYAGTLSLLDPIPITERPGLAWRLHPLLAELLRRQHGEEGTSRAFDRMTEWFVERLPRLPYGQEEEMGRRWKEVQAEAAALTAWLPRVPSEDRVRVEQAGSPYAVNIGPFNAWGMFCEEMLANPLDDAERSDTLWTLGQVSRRSGLLDRALAAAQEQADLDRKRGAERDAALAAGMVADILQARGQLDDALKIRQDELLPVFEKIGDIRARAVTLGKIADILQARGQLDDALKIRQDEELPVYEKIGDIRSRAVTLGQIADILEARGQLDDALKIRQDEELPVYEKIGDIHSRAVTLGQIADILQARGQLDDALKIRQDEQLPVYEKIGDIRERAVTLGKIADILQARGQLDDALKIRQDEELPVYEKIGDIRERAVTLGKIADILQARGQLDDALKIRQEEELPVYEKIGDIRSRAVTLGKIADILQARGQLDDALKIRQDEELPVYEKIGDIRSRAVTLGQIADILQARGQLDDALKIRQDEELPVYEKIGDIRSRAVTLGKIADILQARGQLDDALKIRQDEELPVYEKIGDIRERAVTLGKIADILQARGQLDDALKIRQEEVLPVYEEIGDVHSLLRGRANLALIYLKRNGEGDRETAKQLLHLALEAAERLRIPEADKIRAILQDLEDPEGDPE